MPLFRIRALLLLLAAIIISALAAREFSSMRTPDTILPAPSLTHSGLLSDYSPSLSGTGADTKVLVYEGAARGGTFLLLGGTHPNEPAGFMAAVVLAENITVRSGRVILIPQACESGFTATDPLEGSPQHFTIPTRSGERSFRFGGRGANVVDQWPDPLVYLQFPSGQQLSGVETRNLNRAYPGRVDGTLTEQTAYAIMELIRREAVTIAVDLHEAAPEIPIINALITHEKGQEIAAAAVLNLEFVGLQYALELSPPNFRGLSHREWGDRTTAIPFLMETSNPIQGRLRGRTSAALVLDGTDPWYRLARELGRMRITYEETGEPLEQRVGRHTQGIIALLEAYNEAHPEAPCVVEGIPTYEELLAHGVGAFLK
jgi:predicted deacylase